MNKINQEKDINAGPFASKNQLRSRVLKFSTGELQNDLQQTYENPWMKLQSAVKTGNIQDQIRVLESLYLSEQEWRRRTHVRDLSRTRFLRQVQNFLAARGLVLGKGVPTACRHISQRS